MTTEEENTTTPSPEADGRQEESKPSLTIPQAVEIAKQAAERAELAAYQAAKYAANQAVKQAAGKAAKQAIRQEVAGLTITN